MRLAGPKRPIQTFPSSQLTPRLARGLEPKRYVVKLSAKRSEACRRLSFVQLKIVNESICSYCAFCSSQIIPGLVCARRPSMNSSLRQVHIILTLAIALALPALITRNATAADRAELDRRMNYWSQRLPFCKWPNIPPYPSKYDANVLYNNLDPLKGQCNDGDGVIFNGVVCISGDDRGCDAVRRSQAADGEFWRSPRKCPTSAPVRQI